MTQASSVHIVLIVRHYPPEVSGGARRPRAFVDAMRARGYRVTIVSPFESDDPDHVHVFNAPIARGAEARLLALVGASQPPGFIRSVKDWARRWAYWPDANIGWARAVSAHPAVRQLTPDLVMTSSPPESSHFAGMRLSRYWRVPWIAEFRDTWIGQSHRQELNNSAFRRWGETLLARRWLIDVSAVVGVSETVLADIRALLPAGIPEAEIGHFAPTLPEDQGGFDLPDDRINLVHAGGFSESDSKRSLRALLTKLAAQSSLNPPLCLHLAGPLSPDEHVLIQNSTIEVRHHGLLSLVRSRELQKAADALLLSIPEASHAIPGKLAEYWQTQTPILRFGYSRWVDDLQPGALLDIETAYSSLRKNMTAPARDDRFSLTRAMDQYEVLIEDTLRLRSNI